MHPPISLSPLRAGRARRQKLQEASLPGCAAAWSRSSSPAYRAGHGRGDGHNQEGSRSICSFCFNCFVGICIHRPHLLRPSIYLHCISDSSLPVTGRPLTFAGMSLAIAGWTSMPICWWLPSPRIPERSSCPAPPSGGPDRRPHAGVAAGRRFFGHKLFGDSGPWYKALFCSIPGSPIYSG